MFLRSKATAEGLGRPARRALIAVGAGAVVWALLLGEGGWLHLRQLRQENARLTAEVERLRREQAHVAADLAALEQPASLALERVARERYGMQREDERVVHVLGSDAAAAR